MITDALVETGDYAGAVKAAQKMIDLRPESSSYARVSYLRELQGDTEGAIQAMTLAVKAANPNDPEGMAWYRAQLRGTEHRHETSTHSLKRTTDFHRRIADNYSQFILCFFAPFCGILRSPTLLIQQGGL